MIRLSFARAGTFLVLAMFAHGASPSTSAGQVYPRGGGFGEMLVGVDSVGSGSASDRLNSTRTTGVPARSGPLLDRTVSRTDYILGPGDDVILSIFGFRSETFPLSVSPEGTVVIPTIGVARVGGLNIEEAEWEIARQVRRTYQDVEVNVTLASVRSFKVFVVGQVPNAGMHEATAVTRVSEVIPQTSVDEVVHRNIQVRRATGETLPADLAVFLQLGDLTNNPALREGDVIHVPFIDETVTVSGSVAFPGVYAYRTGETISDILHIANGGGPFPSEAADTIRLMRFSENPRGDIESLSRFEAMDGRGSHLPLEPFDALYVPRISNFRDHTTATIEGEVERPGQYPIRPGFTTVRELVEMAGGFTPEASLVEAVLRREPEQLPGDSVELLENVPPELLSREDRRILEVTRRADERAVVIDFRRLFNENDTGSELTLMNGDQLYVPEHRNEVSVLGAVTQPGILQYVPGQSIEYFVERAGGYSRRADQGDLVVIKGRLGNRLERSDVEVLDPGDRIIVPFREPRTFMERVQTAQYVVGTISGFVLTIVGLERLWDTVVN